MAFTYGFYNSLNGDRKYNAFQMSKLFDGIILDGVFETIGQHFAVTAGSGMSVNVGTGRAWFNHTWNENDSVMPINLPQSDLNRARYDAIVIEVGDPNTTRENSIKVVSGTPAVNPSKPTLNRGPMNNSGVSPDVTDTQPPYQHALAYILVPAGATSISATNIQIVVGMDETPFVTGPIETRSIEELFNQWDAQFSAWFSNLQAQLTENVVTNLQNQIDQNRTAIEGINANIDGLKVETKTYTEIITNSRTWTNSRSNPINVSVMLFGGGGAGNTAGGGGGHMATWSGQISPQESVSITIGNGGNGSGNGGTTSFGTKVSANGGNAGNNYNGGNGGTGGGGSGIGRANAETNANGGNGSYGGGGGGGSYSNFNSDLINGNGFTYSGGNGGKGGTYGGGGGGGGAGGWADKGSIPAKTAGAGGSKGTYGGAGGKGGTPAASSSSASGGHGGSGTNTQNQSLEFVGYGYGGVGEYGAVQTGRNLAMYLGGGGAGGGGYGGNGGNGGAASVIKNGNYYYGYIGSGGGGGGYGAPGGSGVGIPSEGITAGGGGGGGGYGGKGGAPGYTGEGYGAGGSYNGCGGGGGYGQGIPSKQSANGNAGVCIIRYTVKEIVIT